MANTGQPNTNGSQFFINQNSTDISAKLPTSKYPKKIIEAYKEGGNPSLDGKHPVFGQVIDGMDAVSYTHLLPLIYEKREVINTLYTTQVDPCWKEFLRGTYSEWVLKNVNYQLKYNFNKEDIAYIITTMAISFIEVWIRKDNPIPPEEYRETFIQLAKTSLCDYIVS